MIKVSCAHCSSSFSVFPSRYKKSEIHFCNKSCHITYRNLLDNPSKKRDLSGENNPMFGKHPIAWNKGKMGEDCHNWKGGIHTRKDGYVRINIDGKRELLHRHLLKEEIHPGNVVHHIDHNPSNNKLSNLVVLSGQSDHARLHMIKRHASNHID